MPAPNHHARTILARIVGDAAPEEVAARYRPRPPAGEPLPPRVPATGRHDAEALQRRRAVLAGQGIDVGALAAGSAGVAPEDLRGNIENLVGFASVPVGVIGPLRVNGTCASGDYYVPMATTEGALVASYHRGATVVSQAGGAMACCLTESVARAPCFQFRSIAEVGGFLAWILPRYDQLQSIVSTTSGHCRLIDLGTSVLGKEVYLSFEFSSGDAAGQNMVTLATEAICRWIIDAAPVRPAHWFLDGNLSGDKKATMLAFTRARGKKVVAEAIVPSRLVKRYLHTDPEQMVRYWQISVMGGIQSGSIGVHGHIANALAALFIACGQDAACVAEASVGVTRMDLAEGGALYVSVSLPNMIVGTVGGGTWLPTASACLAMLGCKGDGKARAFAEICGATVLAGEVSIIGAMAAGDFAEAHASYGRRAGKR